MAEDVKHEEGDDEKPQWEQIPLDPFDRKFLEPIGQEIQRGNQVIERLNAQINQLNNQLNQVIGEINANQRVVNSYVVALDEKYGIPKDISYVFDFEHMRLIRKDLLGKLEPEATDPPVSPAAQAKVAAVEKRKRKGSKK